MCRFVHTDSYCLTRCRSRELVGSKLAAAKNRRISQSVTALQFSMRDISATRLMGMPDFIAISASVIAMSACPLPRSLASNRQYGGGKASSVSHGVLCLDGIGWFIYG